VECQTVQLTAVTKKTSFRRFERKEEREKKRDLGGKKKRSLRKSLRITFVFF
jgi:hypothetical protein